MRNWVWKTCKRFKNISYQKLTIFGERTYRYEVKFIMALSNVVFTFNKKEIYEFLKFLRVSLNIMY